MEKQHLVPVTTSPPVNEMLETFSREHSAAQSSKISKSARIPKIGNLWTSHELSNYSVHVDLVGYMLIYSSHIVTIRCSSASHS